MPRPAPVKFQLPAGMSALPPYTTLAPKGGHLIYTRVLSNARHREALGLRHWKESLRKHGTPAAQVAAAYALKEAHDKVIAAIDAGNFNDSLVAAVRDGAARDAIIAGIVLQHTAAGRLALQAHDDAVHDTVRFGLARSFGADSLVRMSADQSPAHQLATFQAHARATRDAIAADKAPTAVAPVASAAPTMAALYPAMAANKAHSASQQAAARAAIAQFAKFLGSDRPVSEVTESQVAQWRDVELSKEGVASERKKLGAVKAFLNWARVHGAPTIGKGVVARKDKRSRDELRQPFSGAQVDAIFTAARTSPKFTTPTLSMLLRLAFVTGARVDELAQLTPADVTEWTDPSGATRFAIEIRGANVSTGRRNKGGADGGRTVPVSANLSDFGAFAASRAGKPLLFGDKMLVGNGFAKEISDAFTALLIDAGVKERGDIRLSFHSIRHTVVQTLQNLGCPLAIECKIVGHALPAGEHAGYGRGPQIEAQASWVDRLP